MTDDAPKREDFLTATDYERAYRLWWVLRRDTYLTKAEADAKYRTLVEIVREQA